MDQTMGAMSALPDPPYPPETKTKGWRFELDYERILQSDTWALANAAGVTQWALALWFQAWMQTPTGTLPVDESVIAARLGIPIDEFRRHKDVLLRGWVEHSDGRLYHAVLTERTLAMISKRDDDRERQRLWREKMKEKRGEQTQTEPAGLSKGDAVTCDTEVTTSESTVNPTPVPVPVPVPIPKEAETRLSSSAPPNIDASMSRSPSDKLRAQAVQILNHLNDKSGRKFRPVDETLKPIMSRLKRGATLEEMLAVIDVKVTEWRHNDVMRQNLNPLTLFGQKYFEKYLVQAGDVSAALTLKEWMRTIGESGQGELLDELYAYANSAKIPLDWAHLTAWEMRERGELKQERRSDWWNHLRLALRSNSLRLWRVSVDGTLVLTEAGLAAENARKEADRRRAEAKRQEQSAETSRTGDACSLAST